MEIRAFLAFDGRQTEIGAQIKSLAAYYSGERDVVARSARYVAIYMHIEGRTRRKVSAKYAAEAIHISRVPSVGSIESHCLPQFGRV